MGPTLPISEEVHKMKYRLEGESFREAMTRIATPLADTPEEFKELRAILLNQRFLPGGRIQSAIGSPRQVTAFNCFVSAAIEDSMDGIMEAAKNAARTMRLGGGIGYDFSTIRPRGERIISLDSKSSGPVSFMEIFDAVCKTVASAGQRRGAQMAVLRVDHPDIEEFVEAKTNLDKLTQFNISVAATDEFMLAVSRDEDFPLRFEGRIYDKISARNLWDKIMRNTWDWAEPGILFIDRINKDNNLWYCETISATNPCAEQPLPPDGACLLGSFNLVKYIAENKSGKRQFEWSLLAKDIDIIVRAMDRVIDNTIYPLDAQKEEAEAKRRMGLGYTGLANAIESLGFIYASPEFNSFHTRIARFIANNAYQASARLAKVRGAFPLFDKKKYLQGAFIKRLDKETRNLISKHGIRNSHLLSIAPTGTISLSADNVSSGCEPVFSLSYQRTILTEGGTKIETVTDFGYRELGVEGKTSDKCTVSEHLAVLTNASKWVDSAVSKTVNVGPDVTWDQFKDIYSDAWQAGCKGVSTFRSSGKRFGILNSVEQDSDNSGACFIDPETGNKSCE